MEYLRTLRNNNVIYYLARNEDSVKQCNARFSLRFVFSGSERYNTGKRELAIYPDTFLALNKNTQYSSTADSDIPVRSFGISFDDEFLESFKNQWYLSDHALLNKYNYLNKFEDELSETIYPLKADMAINIYHLKRHLENGVQNEELINEYLKHCLINYFRIYKEEVFQKAECIGSINSCTRFEILRRLSLAREYLFTNYNENITLEELAEYSCLSVTHLLRTFKCAFNITPHQFLIQLRLKRARLFLKETDYPVNEVVNLVGFECASSFIRLFKEYFNITPLQYRQIA